MTRVQEFMAIRDAIKELFPQSPAAAAQVSSVADAERMMRLELDRERFLTELRRQERLDSREDERKWVSVAAEQQRAEALTKALGQLPDIIGALMASKNGAAGVSPAPPVTVQGAVAPATNIQNVPAQRLDDGSIALGCPNCHTPVRLAVGQMSTVCPNPACKEPITVHE